MSEDLLDIQVDADDYAETAAGDTPTNNDRTLVTEEQFQQTKATYRAKIDSGSIYLNLPAALPPPCTEAGPFPFPSAQTQQSEPPVTTPSRLNGKNVQLIAAAAGELYYFRHYTQLTTLLAWLRAAYDVPAASLRGRKLDVVFDEWAGRCAAQLAKGHE